MTEPVPFEVYEEGVYLHGTKAMLAPGELLLPAQPSNYRAEAPLRHLYLTETLHAAAWGAQLARGDGEPRIYVVESTESSRTIPTSPTGGSPATPPAPTAPSNRCAWCASSRTGRGTARRA